MKKFLAIFLAFAMIFSLAGCGAKKEATETEYKINQTIYPDKVIYPDYDKYDDKSKYELDYLKWDNHSNELINLSYKIFENKNLEAFYYKTIKEMLKDEANENIVYSPINVFFAFAILAEVTDGSSRNEILDALGMNNINELRSVAKDLYKANYVDDGIYTSLLNSSLWLNDEIEFNRTTIDNLALYYYANAFKGDMEDSNFSKEFKKWLNDNTGNLLEKQIDELEPFDARDVLVIATSVYFKGRWESEFFENNTKDNTFYTANGPIATSFMQKEGYMQYLERDEYTAISSKFTNGGKMWFFLPNIGYTINDLIENDLVTKYILSEPSMSYDHVMYVEAKVPKFDISSTIDLIPKMENIGIKDVFDSRKADFSPLTDLKNIAVTTATHSARVKIDEEGCEAAAFTVLGVKATAMPPQEPIIFKADRPFVFAITGNFGNILFSGVVNNPNS